MIAARNMLAAASLIAAGGCGAPLEAPAASAAAQGSRGADNPDGGGDSGAMIAAAALPAGWSALVRRSWSLPSGSEAYRC